FVAWDELVLWQPVIENQGYSRVQDI
ncbi:unnamed protein product, partial [Rotaria sp. Silwood2]